MRLGLIVLSIGDFGKKGYYNLQEIGLAKELDLFCEEVKVYKLVAKKQTSKTECIDGTKHATITYLPSKAIGTNGIPDISMLDSSMDAYVCFSDTQFMFPRIYKWAIKNGIKLFPYIGVTVSHSANRIKEFIINTLFRRNLKIYRQCDCFTKTPSVQLFLKKNGIANAFVIPVGLDLSLTKSDYDKYDVVELRQKYGFERKDKILLFIGRMIEEKKPMDVIEVLNTLADKNENYRLVMVGTGELKGNVEKRIKDFGLVDKVKMIDRISNSDIWELYCIADCFVNLNDQEIFGMAIMEAMYYGCQVVAMEAPGPNLIVENGVSGFLVKNKLEMIKAIEKGKIEKENMRNRIVREFTWRASAEKMMAIIGKGIMQ